MNNDIDEDFSYLDQPDYGDTPRGQLRVYDMTHLNPKPYSGKPLPLNELIPIIDEESDRRSDGTVGFVDPNEPDDSEW